MAIIKVDDHNEEDGWVVVYSPRKERYVRIMPAAEWRERQRVLEEVSAAPPEQQQALFLKAQKDAAERKKVWGKEL